MMCILPSFFFLVTTVDMKSCGSLLVSTMTPFSKRVAISLEIITFSS